MNNGREGVRRGGAYLNGALTVIGALLIALIVQGGVGLPAPASANAQTGRGSATNSGGLVNPADDRREMLVELRKMNQKMDELISALGKSPIDVNVVKMPEKAAAVTE